MVDAASDRESAVVYLRGRTLIALLWFLLFQTTPAAAPILLAGHAIEGLKQGAHYVSPSNVTLLSNLFVTMLQQMGANVESFADSTGDLKSLT